jgi:ferrochelatase
LVELDLEYAEIAKEAGIPAYFRVPTVSTHPAFIAGLAVLARRALARGDATPAPDGDARICPPSWTGCPCRTKPAA